MFIKNFKVLPLVFILLSIIAENSIASYWVFVTSNEDAEIFVDMQSLQIHERDVKVWEKWVNIRPKEVKDSSLKNTYNLELNLSLYHCDEATYHLLKIDRYSDQKGSLMLMESYSYPETPPYKLKIMPDSVVSQVMDFVCGVKKTPKQR